MVASIPYRDQALFKSAKARWESVITGDLTDIGSIPPDRQCYCEGCVYPAVIDDLHVCAEYPVIDGPGQILGYTGIVWRRAGNGLPVAGYIKYDIDDMDIMRYKQTFPALVQHDMGWVIGKSNRW